MKDLPQAADDGSDALKLDSEWDSDVAEKTNKQTEGFDYRKLGIDKKLQTLRGNEAQNEKEQQSLQSKLRLG